MWLHTIRNRDYGRVTPVFGDCAQGIRPACKTTRNFPTTSPSPTPSSNSGRAVEPVPDEEASAERPVDVPLEVAPADWQEQLETVELDAEFDEIDR